jgi:hypothetical protein
MNNNKNEFEELQPKEAFKTESKEKRQIESAYKKSIEKYFRLYLDGSITKEDLISVLSE